MFKSIKRYFKDTSVFRKNIIHAILSGNLENFKKLIEDNDYDVNNNFNNKTLIIQVLILNRTNTLLDMIKYLVDKGADINKEAFINNKVPLYYAALYNKLEIVKYLVEHGADINIKLSGKNEISILYDLIRYDENSLSLNIVKYLVEKGAKTDIFDDEGKSLLYWARENNPLIYRYLKGISENKGPKSDKLYDGYSKSDILLFNQIFSNPEDYSICPVCLEYTERTDGCRYMKHQCEEPYNKKLFDLYSVNEEIEWCTICGRICNDHRHYKYASPTSDKIPELEPYAASTAGYFGGEKECIEGGGGGFKEKVRRLYTLISEACKLQSEIGSIKDIEARTKLSDESWKSANDKNLNVSNYIKNKEFKFDCIFQEKINTKNNNNTNNNNNNNNNNKRPNNETDLVPKIHKSPNNICCAIGDSHDDKRVVWEFQHKQKDGSLFDHKSCMFCVEDLIEAIKSNTIDGRCFIPQCESKLYPDELKYILDSNNLDNSEQNMLKEFYTVYKRLFNKSMKGGGYSSTPLLRHIIAETCKLYSKKKNKTYKNKIKRVGNNKNNNNNSNKSRKR
jgi:hypothetical protein